MRRNGLSTGYLIKSESPALACSHIESFDIIKRALSCMRVKWCNDNEVCVAIIYLEMQCSAKRGRLLLKNVTINKYWISFDALDSNISKGEPAYKADTWLQINIVLENKQRKVVVFLYKTDLIVNRITPKKQQVHRPEQNEIPLVLKSPWWNVQLLIILQSHKKTAEHIKVCLLKWILNKQIITQ